uniref:Uncharacterized protein n=1 Tax=Anopheles maculatus TaxID=74869 RepID=A0A182T267_9DIPT
MLNNFIPPTYKTNQWRRKRSSSNESKANESNKNVLPALIEFIDSSEQLPAFDINKETRLQIVEHPVIHALLYKNVLPALIEFIDSSEQLPASDINKETRLQIVEHPVIHALLYIRDPPSKWYIRAES